jgi:neutral ceramidase
MFPSCDMSSVLPVLASPRGRGAVAWYPVHCTSINNTNSLISGDNKGVAAQFMEAWAEQGGSGPGQAGKGTVAAPGGGFVGAFAQSNVGDTSPNVQGAFCQDTGAAPASAKLRLGPLRQHCLTEGGCCIAV